MNVTIKTLLSLMTCCSTLLLASCGGGGNEAGAPATDPAAVTPAAHVLSATQANFEAFVVRDSYVTFLWNLPSTNVAPASGTHFFISGSNSALASPSTGPQTNTGSTNNLTSTLALPDFSRAVSRVLKNGVIYVGNLDAKQVWSYQGNDVLLTAYAVDGVTAIKTEVYDNWSAPIPLSGQISNTAILKSFLGFTRLNMPLNFDFTKNWLAGATYITRKAYTQADTLYMYDCSSNTYDANVSPCTGATTIEALFNLPFVVTAGGIGIDGVLYTMTDGAITNTERARTWIATNKRPASTAPTDGYATFIELNGKIYFGAMLKAGTRSRSIDGVDTTVINDFNIRLNSKAADSIKQTIKF